MAIDILDTFAPTPRFSAEEFIFDKNITAYRLSYGRIEAVVLSFGGILQSLKVDGVDVVCGYDDIDSYLNSDGYLGAIIGRYANRIRNGVINIGGKKYDLFINDKGSNSLHGGKIGFDKRIWNGRIEGTSLILSLFSPDGDENYPSNLYVCVSYTLTPEVLSIGYDAICDGDTPLCLTNHSYFNLDGFESGSVLDQKLTLNCNVYSAVDEKLIPVSREDVTNTPFDFRNGKTIGQDIKACDEQIILGGGFDHNFFIDRDAKKGYIDKIDPFTKDEYTDKELTLCAIAEGKVKMEVYTDMPCVQLYTGNFMGGDIPLKNGVAKKNNGGFCLETQIEPNSPENNEGILKKGQRYDSLTVFRFPKQ